MWPRPPPPPRSPPGLPWSWTPSEGRRAGGGAAGCSSLRARALFCACGGEGERRRGKGRPRGSRPSVLGGRGQRLSVCRGTWQGRGPVGRSLQPRLPRVPDRGGGFVSAGNCWLLGKLSCQVRHGSGGCVWDADRHSEFTNVYRAAQQGNGSVGGGEVGSSRTPRSATGTPAGMAPPARSSRVSASQRLL